MAKWNAFNTQAFYAIDIERGRGRDDSMTIRRVVLPTNCAVWLVRLSPRTSPRRVVLPIVFGALWAFVCLGDAACASADEFTLTFTGDLSGTGSMTTDGICSTCTKTAGLLSLTINLGSFSGASAFDIVDDDLGFGGPAYNRSSNSLDAPLWDLSESPGAQLVISSQGSWEVSAFVGGRFSGTYAISPAIAAVPEPNTFAILVTAVGLLGFMIRWKTHFACAIKETGPRAVSDAVRNAAACAHGKPFVSQGGRAGTLTPNDPERDTSMTRTLLSVLTIAALLLLQPLGADAAPVLSVPFVTVGVGDTFTIPLSITGATDVTSWQFDLAYSPSIVKA